MDLSVKIIKEGSVDPYFKLNVSYSDNDVSFKDCSVEVIRIPPALQIVYAPEIMDVIDRIDKAKMELEVLQKVMEFMLKNSESGDITRKIFR